MTDVHPKARKVQPEIQPNKAPGTFTWLVFLYFLLSACASESQLQIERVTPAELTVADMPATVRLEGSGFSRAVNLKLDNRDRAVEHELTVTLGGVALPIVNHPNMKQVDVEISGFAEGVYELRLEAALGRSVSVPFSVRQANAPSLSASASSLPTASSGPALVATSSPSVSESVTASLSNALPPLVSSEATMSVADGAPQSSTTEPFDAWTGTNDGSLEEDSGGLTSDADASGRDAATPPECIAASLLFEEDYEGSDLSKWTSVEHGKNSCEVGDISAENVLEGQGAFRGEATCPSNLDHELYGALQFAGDTVLGGHVNSGTGIDAPNGVVISFSAWADFAFTPGNGEWAGFLLLDGSCDWTDAVLSVATGNSSDRLSISHTEVDGGSETEFPEAPVFPKQTFTRITTYVNYATGTLVVWQDGVPVTRADFVRPGTTLCHIRVGMFANAVTEQMLMYIDNTRVWRLEAPLPDVAVEPCMATGQN